MTHTLFADTIQLEFGPRRILYGDLPALNRSVRFDGVSITHPYRHPRLLLYLPQYNFIPPALPLRRVLVDYQLEFRDMEKMLPELRITHRSRIRDLSGGQQRLINLYIVLHSPSQFALLDEPFTHLMPLQIEKVKEMLLEEKTKKGWLITDHLYNEVTSIADRLYVLADGITRPAKTDQDLSSLGYIPR